jgi:cell division protein FtsI (penicillin-binding protein 3)
MTKRTAFSAMAKRREQAFSAEVPRADRFRHWLVLGAVMCAALGLSARAALLQTEQKEFLLNEGDARHLRVVKKTAHRGAITDRRGQALAISTPVESVWVTPRRLAAARDRWPALVRLLSLDGERLHRLVAERMNREFMYLRRHVTPDVANAVRELEIPGVSLQREYRRYYPAGEVVAHVLGFTNIDDKGQEGIELAYDDWLRGIDGAKHVIRDRLGRNVQDVANVRKARSGRDMAVSLDLRIQTLAYRSLKHAVKKHSAKGGSAVVLDARTGEVLAMVNQPSYNPNNRRSRSGKAARNRAVTDVIEPGSTVKPFTVAAALEAGTLHSDSSVDTNPGSIRVGRHLIKDPRNYGLINVADVLKRSSNVGVSKIALATPPDALWKVFKGVGFGEITASAFPGESGGILTRSSNWPELERATLAFGYGLSVTPLQLARAYLVFANDGWQIPVTFQVPAQDHAAPARAANIRKGFGVRGELALNQVSRPEGSKKVLTTPVARHVLRMMEAVVSPDGTGKRAQIFAYRVAGKTGTARKSNRGGYADNRYTALFAGIAPASDPRLVMVVMIDEPAGEQYYGGQIAAPVFAEVIAGSLRLLRIPPDRPDVIEHRIDLTQAILRPDSRHFLPPHSTPERTQAKGDRG